MRLTLHTFLTIDGVMQAPGGPEEDEEGGFTHGGWSFAYGGPDFGEAIANWFANADAFLLGRRTYDIFAGYWPDVTDPDNPIATKLNALPKYVVSTTLESPSWQHTAVISGDVVDAIRDLKRRQGNELQVHGSGGLAQTLIEQDLIDEYRLFLFPVHLGTGKKLFREGTAAASLRLTGSRATETGIVIATYEPDGPPRYGSFADPPD